MNPSEGEAMHYLSAIRSRLEQLYDASADNPRLREQLSDEVDWVDAQLEQSAVPDPVRIALQEAVDVFDGINDDEINVELLPRLRAVLRRSLGNPFAPVTPDAVRAAIGNLGYDLKLREFAPRTEIGIRNFNERCEELALALSRRMEEAMTDRFDWTEILPEPEKSKVRAQQSTFLESFPTREELGRAGREGRAAFAKACATVDVRNESERLLNAAMDHIAGTLEQPTDTRAWGHLLVYCPLDVLEAAYVRKAQRSPQGIETP